MSATKDKKLPIGIFFGYDEVCEMVFSKSWSKRGFFIL